MKGLLLATLVLFGVSSIGIARELDDENSVTNRQLKGTIVLRVDKRTNRADYVKTDSVMSSKDKAKNFAKSAKFKRVPASHIKSELDRDAGSSSWYFYNYNSYNSYNPYCNYYGYNYPSYYSYNTGYYNYYYYGNCYWGRGYGCY